MTKNQFAMNNAKSATVYLSGGALSIPLSAKMLGLVLGSGLGWTDRNSVMRATDPVLLCINKYETVCNTSFQIFRRFGILRVFKI